MEIPKFIVVCPGTNFYKFVGHKNATLFHTNSIVLLNKTMNAIITAAAIICSFTILPTRAAVYTPTAQVGEFLRQFEKAYTEGDHEWIRSAVDKEGVVEVAKAIFFGF